MKTPRQFNDIYQFNVLMLHTTKSFPKDYKFSLGERIKKMKAWVGSYPE
jgi:hypothetical protein